ncbi:MAG: biliverdin-producing heme oxygenase [Cytophagales bacterium]|nr:MAG: biliverdin-producing heme oxygenase [Cytophagales bacterium]
MNTDKLTTTNILLAIKQATTQAHDKIELNPLTKAITDNTITQENYLLLLKKFYGFYQATEPLLKEGTFWQQMNFDIQQRSKTPYLLKDLQYFGLSTKEIQQIPICKKIPTLDTTAQKIAYLYVIEGSSLGGQVLSRQLHQKFQFTAQQGAAYFNSYGKENLKNMWFGFQNLLTNFAEQHPEEEAQMIKTAKETFEKLDLWLATSI